jgi:hypothetical protein
MLTSCGLVRQGASSDGELAHGEETLVPDAVRGDGSVRIPPA